MVPPQADPSSPSGTRAAIAGRVPDHLRGYLLVAGAAGLWAVSGNMGKYAMKNGVSALALAQSRNLIAALCLLAYVGIARRRQLRVPRTAWLWLVLFGIFLGLVQFSYFGAIERIQVAAAILLEYLAPVLVVAFAWLVQGRRASGTTIAALVAALAGCAFVVQAYDPSALSLSAVGVGFGLAAAVTCAGYILVGEHVQDQVAVAPRLLYGFGVAFILLALMRPPLAVLDESPTWDQVAPVLYVGTLGTLLPFALFMAALRYLDASRSTITSTLEPVLAGIVAFVWFGETLEPLQLVGAALVLGAVVTLQLDRPSPEFDQPFQG